MLAFLWNDCNVCLDPLEHIYDTPTHYIRIYTAYDGDKWLSGHRVFNKKDGQYFGSSSPVCRNSKKSFDSERQAIIHELRLFLGWWDLPEKVKKVIREHLTNLCQLSLFYPNV